MSAHVAQPYPAKQAGNNPCNAFITPVSILECPPLQHRLNSDMAQLTISMGIMQQTTTVYAAHKQDRHISLTALG